MSFESSRHDVGHSLSVTVPAHVLPAGVPEHLSHRCVATAQIEHDATTAVALDKTHRVPVRAVPRERESIRRHVLGPGALAGLGLGGVVAIELLTRSSLGGPGALLTEAGRWAALEIHGSTDGPQSRAEVEKMFLTVQFSK